MRYPRFMLASMLFLLAGWAHAEPYPSRPIRYVIGTAPGNSADIVARALAQKLAPRLGQPVIVENKPGAVGLIATNAVLGAEPDGHVMLGSSSAVISQPALVKAFKHDLQTDVTAITTVVHLRTASLARASAPFRTMDQLVAHMKAHPGKINVGVTSAVEVLQATVFQQVTNTQLEQVRYTSTMQAYNALLAGEIDLVFGAAIALVKQHVDAGNLRFISVNGTERDRQIPDVPTLAESPSSQVRELAGSALFKPIWLGLMVSSKVPDDKVERLFNATREVMKDPEFIERMQAAGLEVVAQPLAPKQATAELIRGAAEIARVAKDAGVQSQ